MAETMATSLVLKNREPARGAGFVRAWSQNSAKAPFRPRQLCLAAGLIALALVGGCGSSLGSSPDGGPTTCTEVSQAYSDAVLKAQECTVGAVDQCSIQVRASFWCNCMTWVNGGATMLATLANQYQALGCQSVCNGICAQPQSLECQADTTSSTGGRCKPPALLTQGALDDGGTFSVPVGYEIDILLISIGPAGYEMRAILSSDAATVLEVTIPAGPITPAGPPYLYRLKALSPGQVIVEIPHFPGADDASVPSYTITLNIN
jgi:hypothetical protein